MMIAALDLPDKIAATGAPFGDHTGFRNAVIQSSRGGAASSFSARLAPMCPMTSGLPLNKQTISEAVALGICAIAEAKCSAQCLARGGACSMSFLNQATLHQVNASYGYIAIFGIILLESAGIPLPGETILIGAAVYAGSHQMLDLRLIIATAAGAAILGDNIGYWLGRTLGRKALLRWGRLIGLDQRKLDLGEYLFLRHGGKIVFLGRFVAVLRVFAAVLAGANRFPPLPFLLFNVLGGIAWAVAFGTGGFLLGQSFHRVAGPFGWLTLAAAAIALLLIWRYYKRHEERLLTDAERELALRRQGRP